MNISRIDGNPITGNLNLGAGLTHDRAGSLAGEQVLIPKDAASILADAAEELSVALSQMKESVKDFNKLEVGGASRVQRMRIEQIQAYLDASRQFTDPDKLAKLVKQLQSSANPGDLVKQEPRTPALRFTLLQLALANAIDSAQPQDLVDRLQDALDELEFTAGTEIRAGLNTIKSAEQFEPTAQGVENHQRAYVEIVLGETFTQALMVVLKRLSGAQGQDFARGLQSLLHALGADLSAARSSIDPIRLQVLIQDIYQMEVAGSVLERCNQLSTSIAARFGIDGVVPLELMKELVVLVGERWVMPDRLRAMARKFLLNGVPERIAFHSGVKGMLGDLPVKVFNDLDARSSLLENAQLVLDGVVQEEESA